MNASTGAGRLSAGLPEWRLIVTQLSKVGAVVAVGIVAGVLVARSNQPYVHLALTQGIPALVLGVLAIVAWRRPQLGLFCIVLLLPFQQFLLARVFSLGVDARFVALLRLWKELLIIVLATRLVLIVKPKWDRLDRLILGFLGFVGVYLVMPIGPPLYARLLGARGVGMFLVLFLVARHLPSSREVFDRLETLVLIAACTLAAFAFWNSFAPDAFGQWVISVGVPSYWAAIQGAAGLPIVFFGQTEGASFVRAGSLLLAPTALAYYLLIPLALVLARVVTGRAAWWHFIVGGFIGAGLVLTLTRSALAAVPLMIFLALATGRKRTTLSIGVIVAVFALAPLAISLGVGPRLRSSLNTEDSSTAAHVAQLRQSRERVLANPFGTGLATAGALSRRFDVEGSITNESWYLQVATELGIFGALLYIFVVVLALRHLWVVARQRSRSAIAALCALAAIAAGGLVLHNLEEHSIGWTLWILAGIALREPTAGSPHVREVGPSQSAA